MNTLSEILDGVCQEIAGLLTAATPSSQVEATAIWTEYPVPAEQTNELEDVPHRARAFRLTIPTMDMSRYLAANTEALLYRGELLVWYPRTPRWSFVAQEDILDIRDKLLITPSTVSGIEWRGMDPRIPATLEMLADDKWTRYRIPLQYFVSVTHTR